MRGLLLVVTLVVMLIAAPSHAGHEYGSMAELHGKRTVFVDTGTNMKARRAIIEELQALSPSLTVADRITGADVALEFKGDAECGEAIVYSQGENKDDIRVLGDWEGCPKTPFLKATTACGRWFADEYKKANR